MCGRYYIETDDKESRIREIIDEINKKYENEPELTAMKTGEIFPTDVVPAVTAEEPKLMKWGFPRFGGKGQVINARLESADEKPLFRQSFAGRRCLLPASNYFEWEKTGTKKKYAIGLREPLFMAGLYRFEESMQLPVFVILTRPAAESLSFIHDRMPVILPKAMQEKWLTGTAGVQEVLNGSVEDLEYTPESTGQQSFF